MKLYIGNLHYCVTEEDINAQLQPYGEIYSIKVMREKDTMRSRGFAFADLNDEGAIKAMQDLQGYNMKGRNIKINEAKEK